MKLTVIGCSGSFPGPASPASCYLIQATDAAGRLWSVALDFGSGALGVLQTFLALGELDAVILSHLHADHFLDLCGLYVARQYHPDGAASEKIPIYGPSGTLRRLEAAYGDDSGKFEAVFEVLDLTEAEPVVLGPFRFTPRQVNHPVEAYGLRVECGEAVLAYSGDTDSCPALVEIARDADLLLAEASFEESWGALRNVHLTGKRAGEVAVEAGAKRLVLTHIPVWTNREVVATEARGVFDGPVEVASSGLVIEL